MANILNYNELYKISINHEYFSSGTGAGIKLLPTQQTQKLLRNGRMIFKWLKNYGILFFQAIDNNRTPLVELPQGTTFTFIIHAENRGEFVTVTDQDEDPNFFSPAKSHDRTQMILFKIPNISNTQNVVHQLIQTPKTRLFNYQFEITGNPSNVDLEVEKTDLSFSNLTGTNDQFVQQLDMRNFENGKYNMKVTYNTNQTLEEEIFVDDALSAAGVIGLVEITLDPSDYSALQEYDLQFKK